MSRQSTISDARAAFSELLAAVDGLDEAAMSAVFSGEWGVKQIIAHVGGWQRLNGEMMERMARGEKPIPDGEDYSDDDAMNAGFAAPATAGTGADAVRELRSSFERFMTAAEALPEERFGEGRFAGKLVTGNGIWHVREHADEIRAYRATLS